MSLSRRTNLLVHRCFAPIHDPRTAGDLRWAFWLVVIALVLRTVSLFFVPLIPEEAYYWMYGQNLQLSYFDHPPMVAWIIRAGVAIFGNTEFGVRVFATLLSLATPILMYRMARLWCDRRGDCVIGARPHSAGLLWHGFRRPDGRGPLLLLGPLPAGDQSRLPA